MTKITITVHEGLHSRKVMGFLRWAVEAFGAEVEWEDKKGDSGKHYRRVAGGEDPDLSNVTVHLQRKKS